jgi:hypothetical protein
VSTSADVVAAVDSDLEGVASLEEKVDYQDVDRNVEQGPREMYAGVCILEGEIAREGFDCQRVVMYAAEDGDWVIVYAY